MSDRTKGIWKIHNIDQSLSIRCNEDNGIDWIIATVMPNCGTGEFDENRMTEESKANANFICKAVNMHDELVEALAETIKFGCHQCNGEPCDNEEGKCTQMTKSRAVLTKAREA